LAGFLSIKDVPCFLAPARVTDYPGLQFSTTAMIKLWVIAW